MAKTQAEYQREYRARKKLTQITNAPETNAPETNAPSVTKCDHPPDMVCGECSAAENKAIFPPSPTDDFRVPMSGVGVKEGPLSVYSPERWAYLQIRKYVWSESSQRAYLTDSRGCGVIGVVVPGDPAYQGVQHEEPVCTIH